MISVCDWFSCQACPVSPGMSMSGKPAWNFVYCGKIGVSVQLQARNESLPLEPTLICEIEVYGEASKAMSYIIIIVKSIFWKTDFLFFVPAL